MDRKFTRRTLVKAATGATAGAAALAFGAPSRTFAAPAVVQSTGSKVNVTYWSSWGTANGDAMASLVKKFNESQQDVEVKNEYQGTYEQTAQKLTAALTSNTAPDLTVLSEVNWFKFYLNKSLAPLNDFIKANEIDTSDYVDSFYNEGVRQDQQYWLSVARSTPLFYYNKQLWSEAGLPDRAPETYDELKEWAPKLVKKNGSKVSQYAFTHAPADDYLAWYFQGTIWAFGGHYSDDKFNMTLAEPKGIDAGNFYRDSVGAGWAHVSKDRMTDFYNGVTASIMQSTGSLGGILKNIKFELGSGFLPKEAQPGCPTGGSGISILASSPKEKQEAAFKFMAYLTTPENTTWWSQTTGYMPVRKSAINSENMKAYYEKNPNFKTAVDQLPTTSPQDVARLYIPGGDQILGKGLERITINQNETKPVFEDVSKELTQEAKPIKEKVEAIEG
jgi:sn-glycerol 3-phosphate transport system substrate-binding protein